MNLYSLRIDDHDVAIAADSTVLQAAQEASIAIPTLCFLEGL